MKLYVNARFLTQSITGVQRFAIEISLELKKIYGNNIMFLSSHNIRYKDIAKKLEVIEIGTHYGYLWEQWDLPKYLKGIGKPLLINFCNVAPLCYKKNIITLHDVAYKAFASAYGWKQKFIYNFMIPILIKKCKHVFTVSKFSKKEIIKYYHIKENEISVIYNAVNPIFHPVIDNHLSKEIYILTVSSTGENKNFTTSLKVYRKLSVFIKGLKFYVVGRTLKLDKFSKYKEYAKDNNIIFLGNVSDIYLVKLYSNALAFIYPSIYEGFGIPPLEAEACDCPVIASNSGPLPEILKDSAICENPFDIDTLAKDILEIYRNPALMQDLKTKAKNNLKRFSWEQSAQKVVCSINIIMKGEKKQ